MKLIQQLKHQRQHFEPPLKIADKTDTFFAMALFLFLILLCKVSAKSIGADSRK
jgi:hypothetical protein